MKIQWYPGHMTKARRDMADDIKLIDLMIELVDARIPVSSRNPDIDKLAGGKARLILLNKSDLADEAANNRWVKYFESRGIGAVKLDSRKKADMKAVKSVIDRVCTDKKEKDRRKGIMNRPVRAMVAGIPNVGKSTFINSFAGKSCARTGNKPGVTKGRQWIRLNKDVELLDTPGILWPRFDDETVGTNLAFVGSINDRIINITELSCELISFLKEKYAGALSGRYSVDESRTPDVLLDNIAVSRGCIRKGGESDIDKAAAIVIDDFRSGRLGRISLEVPGQEDEQHD